MFHIYLSPEHAGNSNGDSGWGVDDIERVVDELASKGVVFERYDEGPIITNEKGIATFEAACTFIGGSCARLPPTLDICESICILHIHTAKRYAA